VRLDRSSPELKPELFVNRQGILLNEVIEEGVSKGYIVGISPWGS
jgi:hypothetical protein